MAIESLGETETESPNENPKADD